MKRLASTQGWASLIGILLAVALVMFLFYVYLQPQEGVPEPSVMDYTGAQPVQHPTVTPSGTISAYQGVRQQIDAINERNERRGEELMQEIEAMNKY